MRATFGIVASASWALWVFVFSTIAHAETTDTEAEPPLEPSKATHGPTYPVGATLRLQTFPSTNFYPRYLADPRQSMMKAAVLHVLKSDTPDAGNPLLEFTMGGRVRLLQLHSGDNSDRGVQLSVEAAFIGRFDPDNHYDSIGWNGYYGARFSFKPTAWLALKLAEQHDSGHIGDEYMRRTGRKRLTYTREELAVGAIFSLPVPIRLYTEAGYAFHLGDDTMRRWRGQTGVEAELGVAYAALDATFWQELKWRPTFTAQLGVKADIPEVGRRYGLAAQFENGRSLLGEFYRDRNRTIGGVFWVDL
jgi:hypothetical protein